jgi:hypothetical protein
MDRIPFNVTVNESRMLYRLISKQDGGKATPFILLQKILSVLKWRYRALGSKKAIERAHEVIEDFGESMNVAGGGAKLQI